MMAYQDKLVVALKSNGKVLREFKDTTYIPFGSEYSILIKNLNTVRAIVTITLDGEDVAPGGLVVNANTEIDLERWIKNGNLTAGNKFKFIERSEGVEQARGIKLEDGLLRVEFQFEQPFDWSKINLSSISGATSSEKKGYDTYPPYGAQPIWINDSYSGYVTSSAMRGSTTNATLQASTQSMDNIAYSASSYNDAGITVPGSKSEQRFTTVSSFPLETEKHVIVLKLLGQTPDNKPVIKPVTVDAKPKCVTCNHTNKSTARYCNKCGTSLTIFA